MAAMFNLLLAASSGEAFPGLVTLPGLVKIIETKNSAVCKIVPNFAPTDSPALLITTFGVGEKEPVYFIPGFDKLDDAEVKILEDETKWNNFIGMLPIKAVPSSTGSNFVMTAGGFLVPGKQTGSIDLFEIVADPTKPIRTKLSTDKKGYFYHKVIMYDINNDGRLDILAARANVPTSGKKQGELLWLEQPSTDAVSTETTQAQPWQEHILTSGPDVSFIFEDLNGDGKPEVVATEFFTASQLAIYSCPSKLWSECGPGGAEVEVTVIDDTNGPFFSVEYVDCNNDGRKDLLVTNNEANATGSVFVYEQPSDPFAAPWARHTLSTGYKPFPKLIPGPGRGSPGSALAFHPFVNATGKPSILLSGDDGGFVSILSPSSTSASDWGYTQSFLCNSTGTIGSPDFADVDGDGAVEIAVPFYSEGKVEVYSYGLGPPPKPISQACVACLNKKDPVHLSSDSAWCYKTASCHLVGSLANKCEPAQCTSRASASKCKCTSCNDAACNSVN